MNYVNVNEFDYWTEEAIKALIEDTIKQVKNLDKIISNQSLQNEQYILDYLDTINEYSVKY
jgi:hypothetical protein